MTAIRHTIRFILDGHIVELDFSGAHGLKPTTTVLNYLRTRQGHKGVKEGCAEGDCGACTVVVAEPGQNGHLVYRTVDSCLVFLPMIHGKQLITIENLAICEDDKLLLHPVQQFMVDSNGSQCGYCTSGVVMSLFGLAKNHRHPSREVIEDALTGNLCRCTGYQSILEAAEKIGEETQNDHFSRDESHIYSLLQSILANSETIEIKTANQAYLKPFTLAEALRLRKENPGATLINGSTDVALRQTKDRQFLHQILDISGVDELRYFKEVEGSYMIGSGLSLEQVKSCVHGIFPALHDLLRIFGSLQIRNLATLGGNIGSASPIGDTLPLLMACQAEIMLRSPDAERILKIDDFITGYRKTDLQQDELIVGVMIPAQDPKSRISSYKVSKRKDLDISTVNAAFALKMVDEKVSAIIIAFGGLAAIPKRAVRTEAFLCGKSWTHGTIEEAMSLVDQEFTPISDARADAAYRKSLARNLLMRFFTETTHPGRICTPRQGLPTLSGPAHPVRMVENRPNESAVKHVTGESVFIGDILVNDQLLYGKVVFSKYAHALLQQIDLSKALSVKGVHCILTAKDIPGQNQMGQIGRAHV